MIIHRQLSIKEMQVLIAIQEKPQATLEELATMIPFSKSNIYKIRKNLEASKDFKKPIFTIVANLNNQKLGLQLIDIIIDANNIKQLQIVEKLCETHPYTSYRGHIFGDVNGMYLQFRIPIGTINKIKELFTIFKNQKIINDFKVFPFSNKCIKTNVRVNAWDIENFSWKFDWNEWLERPIKKKTITISEKKEDNFFQDVKKWLQSRDVAVLSELCSNASQKNVEIIEKIEKSKGIIFKPQTFSRRIKRIQEHCIDSFYVNVNPNAFQLITPTLIWGHGDPAKIAEIKERLLLYKIPFMSMIKTEKNLLFWYLKLPTNYLSELIQFLRPILTDLHFNTINYASVRTFRPWYKCFDDERHDWIQDSAFMVDNVLNEVYKYAKSIGFQTKIKKINQKIAD
ncbi:MAG: hypothetical protein ACTSVU_07950 [Promethearchaeota archaeon]